jgi:arginine deiminase
MDKQLVNPFLALHLCSYVWCSYESVRMNDYRSEAEFDRLRAVRVHKPGCETFVGGIDPVPNLFRNQTSVDKAQREHERLVETLETNGVTVHHLCDDLAKSDTLDALLASRVRVDCTDLPPDRRATTRDSMWNELLALPPYEKLQLIGSNATLSRHRNGRLGTGEGHELSIQRSDTTSIRFRRPLSNLYFQRDQQILTDEGPVIGSFRSETREAETGIAVKGWEAIGGNPRPHDGDVEFLRSTGQTLEGGDFIPAGEFALLGVSAFEGDTEIPIRTTHGAGRTLLEADVMSYDEVGLVHAPREADADEQARKRERTEAVEPEMEVMHLDTWFNIADEGIAVARKHLVENTDVEVYGKTSTGYEHLHTVGFGEYLAEKDYHVIDVPFDERAVGTNFLTLDAGTIFPIHYPGADGEYDPSRNELIETMRNHGLDIVPDGVGLPLENLRAGYGGVHCVTTPLRRV